MIFQKPSKNEIILAVLMFAGYMIFSLVLDAVLTHFALNSPSSPSTHDITFISFLALIFSMMGEEMLKFIPLMFFMRIIFKYTSNRSLAVSVSTVLVLIAFAMLHYT